MNWIAEKIYQVPITKIRPYERNARTHSDHQITLLMRAITEFGFTTPILMTSEGTLVAGHGRAEAAKRLGLETVPAIYVDHLSERQRKALVLADNKITSLAGWDFSILAEELNELAESHYDLELTGFNEEELDSLLRDTDDLLPEAFVTAPQEQPAPEPKPLPEGNFEDPGIGYKQQFGVMVVCDDELTQAAIFERLTAEGLKCRIVVT